MDIAIVTGAGSGLGLAITRKLIELGLRVYGLGGQYDDAKFDHEYFVPMPCNMGDIAEVRSKVAEIVKREGDNIYVLVNNAKLYHHKGLGDMTDEELEAVLKVNLLCPLVITRGALASLTRLGGFVINIVANSAENSRGGAIGAATAGGLRWMGEALFEQLREDGVKVCNVFPQTNKWRPDGSVPAQQRPQSAIDIDAVAEAIGSIVLNRFNNVVTDIVIRPQRLAEKPVPAPFNVPYPKPKPLPKTAPREEEEHVTMAETKAEIRKESDLVRQLRENESADTEDDDDDMDVERDDRRDERRPLERDENREDADESDREDFDEEEDGEEHPFREENGEDNGDEPESASADAADASFVEPRGDDRPATANNPNGGSDDGAVRRHRRGRRGGRNRNRDGIDQTSQPVPQNNGEGRSEQPRREFDRPQQNGENRQRSQEQGPRQQNGGDYRPERRDNLENGQPRENGANRLPREQQARDNRAPRQDENRPERRDDNRQPRDRDNRPTRDAERPAPLPRAERDERFERDTRPTRSESQARDYRPERRENGNRPERDPRDNRDNRPQREGQQERGPRPDRQDRDFRPSRDAQGERRQEQRPPREERPADTQRRPAQDTAVRQQPVQQERQPYAPREQSKPAIPSAAQPERAPETASEQAASDARRRNRRNRRPGTIMPAATMESLGIKPVAPVVTVSRETAPIQARKPVSQVKQTLAATKLETKPVAAETKTPAPAKSPAATTEATSEAKPKRTARKPRTAKSEEPKAEGKTATEAKKRTPRKPSTRAKKPAKADGETASE